jgi:hypothetical protein
MSRPVDKFQLSRPELWWPRDSKLVLARRREFLRYQGRWLRAEFVSEYEAPYPYLDGILWFIAKNHLQPGVHTPVRLMWFNERGGRRRLEPVLAKRIWLAAHYVVIDPATGMPRKG